MQRIKKKGLKSKSGELIFAHREQTDENKWRDYSKYFLYTPNMWRYLWKILDESVMHYCKYHFIIFIMSCGWAIQTQKLHVDIFWLNIDVSNMYADFFFHRVKAEYLVEAALEQLQNEYMSKS